jgi:O-antigen ligase
MISRLTSLNAVFLGIGIVFMPFSMPICHLGIILFILSSIIQGNWLTRWRIVANQKWVLFHLVFFMLHLIGLLYADDISEGMFSIEKRIFFFILPLLIITTRFNDEGILEKLLLLFIATCVVATFWCLGHAFYQSIYYPIRPVVYSEEMLQSANKGGLWNNFSYTALSEGINIHPTYFSLYLLFCLLILIELFNKYCRGNNLRKWVWLVVTAYLSFFIILLSSKITTIGLIIVLLFAVVKLTTGERVAIRIAYSVMTVLFVCLTIIINPVATFRNVTEYNTVSISTPKGLQWQSINMRTSLWWVAIKSINHENILTGEGTGSTKAVMKKTSDRLGITNTMDTYDPHNQFLSTMLSFGLPGVIFLCLILFIPFVIKLKHRDSLYILFSTTFLMVCLTESALELQKGIVYYSIFQPLLFMNSSNKN